MIITDEVLRRFGACLGAVEHFREDFPDGFDISPLWGTFEEADALWKIIFGSWLREYVGWGIRNGILPSYIRADLSGANLFGANLFRANLSRASLSRADLSRANLSEAIADERTIWPKGFVIPDSVIINKEVK